MDIKDIFERKLKIESKVMSIASLFDNPDRFNNTNYKPYYQRNYVWDDEKATYFIESILIGTEIPPLIFFRNGDKVEVIDGRQRYETIFRFLNDKFRLKKNGLEKLDFESFINKFWKDLDNKYKDLIWETKIRIIEFSFFNPELLDEDIVEVVKREIFKRYNSGITPLKPGDIDKAIYIEDDLNTFLKNKLESDNYINGLIKELLFFDKKDKETLLKKIRQLFVQHRIPIKYYAIKKDSVIAKYYEYMFSSITDEEVESTYHSFVSKLNIIKTLKNLFEVTANTDKTYNRLITECVYWALSVYENEGLNLRDINKNDIESLYKYIIDNIDSYSQIRSSFFSELVNRYTVTSEFFTQKYNIIFEKYIYNNTNFKKENLEIDKNNNDSVEFEDIRMTKPEPESISIDDICIQMSRQRFYLRPVYQRNEVIDRKKASKIIESILLGIRIPPIFVYKRNNSYSEVIDGQQRLLSILGFLGKKYLNEDNVLSESVKHKFRLSLKDSILSNLNGYSYEDIVKEFPEYKTKLSNFDLWLIEISEKLNPKFDEIDLFIRLNNKPYPIKEYTFEMWNSYISRDIIESIKGTYENNKDWFYLRKNNSRMENENIYTALIYLHHTWLSSSEKNTFTPEELDIYKISNKISFRLKSKIDVSRFLENERNKSQVLRAINSFEFSFINKLKLILKQDGMEEFADFNSTLDDILLLGNGRRTQQSFYALWYFLYDLDYKLLETNKESVRKELTSLFKAISNIETKEEFESKVLQFKNKYSNRGSDEFTSFYISQVSSVSQTAKKHGGTNNSENNRWKIINLNLIDSNKANTVAPKNSSSTLPSLLVNKKIYAKDRVEASLNFNSDPISSDIYEIVVHRGGIDPKFLIAIISSKYYLKTLTKSNNEISVLTISMLKSLKIPYIDIESQKVFATVVDLIRNSTVESRSLFYFNLLDCLVFEIYNKSRLHENNINILAHLLKVEFDADTLDEANIYSKLSNPDSIIASNILKAISLISK